MRLLKFLSLALVALLVTQTSPPALFATTAKPATKAVKGADDASDSGATIYLVVNDTPITAYTIEQRIKLLSLDGSGGWQQRLQAKLHAPDLQERFKAFAMAHNPKSKEEVLALQKQFVEALRQQAIAEGRPGLRDKAVSQILDETLELQEAKRQSVLASDSELDAAVTEIAKRNKKTLKEFQAAIGATGVNVHAFRERIRSQMSWERVIASHFRGQIVVGKTELDQEIAAASASGSTAAPVAAQLKLQRIVIPLKGGDAASSVAGYAAADQLRSRAKPCNNFAQLAKGSAGAHFDDMGMVSTDSLDADVRPMLVSAEAGSVPPPVITKAGIEIYGVCERAAGSAAEGATSAARDKIEREKIGARSHALLSDLCAAASIEPRNGFKLAHPCGSD